MNQPDHSLPPSNQNENAVAKSQGYGIPVAMVVLAAIYLLVINTQIDWLNENYNVNPGVQGLSNFGIPAIVCILCGIFILLFRRGGLKTLLGAVLLGLPFLLLLFIQPVFDGDANIVAAKWRFQNEQPDFDKISVADPVDQGIDLTTTAVTDFPRFLGRHTNATVDGVELNDWKASSPEMLWKQPIGEGWSGFVAVNGYAITQEQRGDLECVTCYRAETGEQIWMYSVERRHEDLPGMGKPGPRATPQIHQGKVYAMSATGILDCLDGRNGELIWSQDIPGLVGISQKYSTNSSGNRYSEEYSTLAWGRATSPFVYQNMVIIPGGGKSVTGDETPEGTATLIALDKETGDVIWKGGKRMIAYGSPNVISILGKDQIVLIAEDHAVGHDPQTGAELWSVPRPGASNGAANCSQVTRISDDQLLFSKGYAGGGQLVQLSESKKDGQYDVKTLKRDGRILKTKLTNPVVFEGHLYSLSDGYLECVQIEGLKRKWKKRGRFGNGQILLVGDRLLVHSEKGKLHLVDANPKKFKQLGALKTIDGLCWNTLCLSGDLLLVRSNQEAACLRLPIKTVSTATTSLGNKGAF